MIVIASPDLPKEWAWPVGGWRGDTIDEFSTALKAALALDGPVLIEAML